MRVLGFHVPLRGTQLWRAPTGLVFAARGYSASRAAGSPRNPRLARCPLRGPPPAPHGGLAYARWRPEPPAIRADSGPVLRRPGRQPRRPSRNAAAGKPTEGGLSLHGHCSTQRGETNGRGSKTRGKPTEGAAELPRSSGVARAKPHATARECDLLGTRDRYTGCPPRRLRDQPNQVAFAGRFTLNGVT